MLTDVWKLTGYVNQGTQTLHVDHYAGYLAELKNAKVTGGFSPAIWSKITGWEKDSLFR